jgi:hypothetical protein
VNYQPKATSFTPIMESMIFMLMAKIKRIGYLMHVIGWKIRRHQTYRLSKISNYSSGINYEHKGKNSVSNLEEGKG